MKKELLLGCGATRDKRLTIDGSSVWTNLVTVDYNDNHKPDVVHDLERLPYPFADNEFDEIHAYEVLEHLGQQGDWKFFFDQFSELHRILKPGGVLCATVPKYDSIWAWGDPSHKRIISHASLVFLSQEQYRQQVGKTPMSDFRFHYKADFEPVHQQYKADEFYFILKAIK